jgi:heat shock protein HslJ
MKKLILIPGLFCLFMLNVASMCSSDDNSSSSQDPTPVVNTATQGTWRVTSYIDSGTDETNHFSGYNFTFATGGVLSAANGTNTYTGTWSVTTDNSNDDINKITRGIMAI